MKSFEGMMSIAKGKKIIVFLDYDGTLSPIVDDPDLAFMPDMVNESFYASELTSCYYFLIQILVLCTDEISSTRSC